MSSYSSSLDFSSPDALASALLREDSTTQILQMQYDGVLPMAIGVGICFTLTCRYFKHHTRDSRLHKLLLLGVSALTLTSFALACANLRNVSRHLDHMSDLYYHEMMTVILTFLLLAVTSYLSQWFFGLRAFNLWHRRRAVAVPMLVTGHVSLLSQVTLDIWGLCQPRFDSATSKERLQEVAQWLDRLGRARKWLQKIWVVSTLACDLLISTLIIVALLRMHTPLASSKGLINKIILLTMETMVPPVAMALLFAIVTISGHAGPGSWFRNTALFQSLFYWFAIVHVLLTRRHFQEMLHPRVLTPPAAAECGGKAALELERGEMMQWRGEGSTAVGSGCGGVGKESAGSGTRRGEDAQGDRDGRHRWTAGFYDGERDKEEQIVTIDEALRGPDLLYDSTEGRTEPAKGLNILV